MHASLAYLNGAGNNRRNDAGRDDDASLRVLHTLLCTAHSTPEAPMHTHADHEEPAVDKSKSQDQLKAETESKEDTFSRPGGFQNDPDDPTNPNEARERHLRKLKQPKRRP